MSKVIIMVGNVGSGKTAWIKGFVKKAFKDDWLVVSKDALRTMLGGGYYKYDESLEPQIDYMSKFIIKNLLSLDKNIIVDETNCDVITRSYVTGLFDKSDIITAIVMPVLSKQRSMIRKSYADANYGYPPSVWREIWERKNSKYVKPDKHEGFDYIVEVEDAMP